MLRTRIASFGIALLLLTAACAKAPEAPPAPAAPSQPAAQATASAPAAATAAPATKATVPAGAATSPAAVPAASPAAAIPKGGELIVAKDQEAPGIDPAKNPASAAIRIFDLLYSRLVRLDNQMRPTPDLAESWDQPDGKTFIFHLRKGVKFHNGRELTSADVKYTFERILNPDTGSIGRSFLSAIDTMETPDNYTFKVNLKTPYTPFLVNTATAWAGIVAKEIVEQNKGDLNKVEAGSGPYKLQEWVPDNRTVLVRNADYYIPGQPYLDKITYQLMPEESARIAALRTGKVDWTILTAAGMDTLKKDPGALNLVTGPTLGYYYLGMNIAKKPFDNVKVRQAISYAVDRKEIIDTVFRGYARLTGPVPSAMADWSIDASKNPYYQPDLNKAKQLMAEAGVTSLKTTIQAMSAQPAQVEAAQVIQAQLKKIGIEAEIQPLETGVYVDNWGKKNMELMVGGNTAGTNPDRAVSFFFSTKGSANVWNFSDARVDEIAATASTLTDQAQAKKLYDEAQQRIIEQAPNLFLANQDDFVAYLPKVKGYKTMPDQSWGYLAQTYLQP